jgi:Protein of unknown function (DUF726)
LDTLDDVQRYAVGALTAVLLSRHARSGDMNGAAYARSFATTVFDGLGLRPGQQAALLALEPSDTAVAAVVAQCVELVGDDATRFYVVQAILALAIAGGVYDARSRALLMAIACTFRVRWSAVAAVELAVAIQLVEEAAAAEAAADAAAAAVYVSRMDKYVDEFATVNEANKAIVSPHAARRTVSEAIAARRKRKLRARRAVKVSGITLVGGLLFGVTGGLIAPALLTALAGVGVASAAGLAATGTVASGAVVGSLFGVAGAGLSVKKAKHRTGSSLTEFDFEREDDPRVIEARQRKAERDANKANKTAAKTSGRTNSPSPPRIALSNSTSSDKDAGGLPAAEMLSILPVPVTEAPPDIHSKSQPSIDGLHSAHRREGGPASGPGSSSRSSLSFLKSDKTNRVSPEQDDDRISDLALGSSDDDDAAADSSNAPSKKRRGRRKEKKYVVTGVHGLDAVGGIPGLHVCICVPGWIHGHSFGSALEQFEDALRELIPCSQRIALRWESRRLYEMSLAFAKFWASKATVSTIQQAYPHAVAAASSVAGAVAFAFALPLTLISCMDYIDNPWSVLLSRSNAAGDELADILIERGYGQRPVTLIGYSLGARVVFKCLQALALRRAYGIVDNVFLMGSPVSADPDRWKSVRPVVAGRILNGHLGIDWALAFFHRGCGHGVYVAGLRKVDVEGVENLDMALLGMEGHGDLKEIIPRALECMGISEGYIVMPPAPLVMPKSGNEKVKNEGNDEDLIFGCTDVGESTGVSSASVRPPSHVDPSTLVVVPRITDGSEGSSHENVIKNCDAAGRGESTALESFWTSELENVSEISEKTPRETGRATLAEESGSVDVKLKKKKGWYSSLNPWGNASKDSITKPVADSRNKTGASLNSSEESPGSTDMKTVVPTFENKSRETRGQISSSDVNKKDDAWEPPPMLSGIDGLNDQIDLGRRLSLGALDSDNDSTIGSSPSDGATFDWELQRRIWEEQERQLRENGIANAPVDVTDCTCVVLGIAVEVTGRRLRNLVPQDAELPTPSTTEVYTNCVDEQQGVVFRLYEHEKRTKILAMNNRNVDAPKYPKLLGKLDLRWIGNHPKGTLRFALSIFVDDAGDIRAKAEQRMRDGKIGDTVEIVVKRSELCTMAERVELDAAERKRLDAEAELERNAEAPQLTLPASSAAADVLLLPAPPMASDSNSSLPAGTISNSNHDTALNGQVKLLTSHPTLLASEPSIGHVDSGTQKAPPSVDGKAVRSRSVGQVAGSKSVSKQSSGDAML